MTITDANELTPGTVYKFVFKDCCLEITVTSQLLSVATIDDYDTTFELECGHVLCLGSGKWEAEIIS